MKNLQLNSKESYSPMRKIGLATWGSPSDPSVYGTITLRPEKVLDYIARFRKKHRAPLTLLQVLMKSVAIVLNETPDANALIRYRRIFKRKEVGVFAQVFFKDKKTGEFDLSGVTIRQAEKKSLRAILDEFSHRLKKVKRCEDSDFEQTRNLFRWLPFFITRPLLNFTAFLSYTLNLNLKWFGIPHDAFGSVMLTNIATLGLEQAYVPIVPYSRVPMLVSIGPVKDEAVVENKELKVGKVLRLFVTFDHRILDGSHAAQLSQVLQKIFDDPDSYLDPVE